MKKTNDNTTKLNRLNKLFKKLDALSAKHEKAYRQYMAHPLGKPGWEDLNAKCEAISADYKKASKEFDALRSEMPRVKFDMRLGEYFYADTVDGDEMFAITVRRTDTFTVRLPARSVGEAEDKAKRMIAEQEKIPLRFLEAEDYSR